MELNHYFTFHSSVERPAKRDRTQSVHSSASAVPTSEAASRANQARE